MKYLTVKKGEDFVIYCGKDRYFVSVEEDGVEEKGADYNYEKGIAKGYLLRLNHGDVQ